MHRNEPIQLVLTCLIALAAAPALAQPGAGSGPTVAFNRDIRGILADNCFACHGPDEKKREARLRLDTGRGAFRDRGGYAVVAPRQPDRSELMRRVTTDNDDERMPPAGAGKKLSPHEVALLRAWIEQGGEWQGHWAYERLTRPALPPAANADGNAIDRFIGARLAEQGLTRAPEADRITLIRRLSFDLIGLAPTPAQTDAFVADQSPAAYEALVDRLLASPHFGERMAVYWLDLVRFADTGGYHSDNHRELGPYRDYVIDAFNDNKPFDRFTIEQLAGDLLENATREQRIGSGYNRLLMTTEEGGAQPKEYAAKYSADRVRNVSEVWLATTMGCVECHAHKYDPFEMKDFYSLAAFFADIKEKAVGRQNQAAVPTAEQADRLRKLDERIAAARKDVNDKTPEPIRKIQAVNAKKRNDEQKKALADFGVQGDWPSHPALLDWLAVEFRASGWDTKHLLKQIALSRTYRQTSRTTAAQRERDPFNRWLARQGRFRLDAEFVRDNALAIGGLLIPTVGGRSVKPYQPAGYWAHLNFPTRKWKHDSGENQYRRGLYTYWQRTFLHPSLLAFDAPSREECTAQRPRSNTPLQALVLLNDPTYVEAARVFAAQIVQHGGATTDDRLTWAYRRALSRDVRPAERKVLADLYVQHLEQYNADTDAAGQTIAAGETPAAKDIDAATLAAWTSIARVILNLHETITRY